MPKTVLPSLGFTTDVWNMGSVQLIQFLMHIWGLYQALIAHYQELQAQNIRLQQIADDAERRAAAAEKRAADAEKRAADAEQRAADAEQRAADAEQRAADAEQRAADAEQRAADAEEDSAYWQGRTQQAERELNARERQEAAEAAILHELSHDSSWTSVSKRNFFKNQTIAVLNAQRETAQIQAKLDKLKSSIAKLAEGLPFDVVTQEQVRYPVIIVPSDLRMDAKIVNIGSAMNLIAQMKSKFPMGQDATIQGVYECADVKNMYEGIFKLLKLCGHNLDE
jgi:chromosome segregation ATPase